MIHITRNNTPTHIKRLQQQDFVSLYHYLQHLSPETKGRFGPHPFDKDSISVFYKASASHIGYIAIESSSNQIIAYAIIKLGFLEHDAERLRSYGLLLNQQTDCTFAPSIADEWQGQGLGNELLGFIITDLQQHTKINRIILWGGVQADNIKAVKFYKKNGFETIGTFEYNGSNFDMVKQF